MTNIQENLINYFKKAGMDIVEIKRTRKHVIVVTSDRVYFIGNHGELTYEELKEVEV